MPQPTKVYTDDEFDDPYFDDESFDDIPSTRDDRALAMVAHLSSLVGFGIIAPLIIYLLKRDDSPFIADQAKEALNFHITVVLALIGSIILMFAVIGFLLLPTVALGSMVFSIIAAVRTNDGEAYRYPLTIRFVS